MIFILFWLFFLFQAFQNISECKIKKSELILMTLFCAFMVFFCSDKKKVNLPAFEITETKTNTVLSEEQSKLTRQKSRSKVNKRSNFWEWLSQMTLNRTPPPSTPQSTLTAHS